MCNEIGALRKKFKFKVTVRMVKPWVDLWVKRPTMDDVMEALADAVRDGHLDRHFSFDVVEADQT